MNTLKNVVKRFRVTQILIACLAGMILLISTACSQPTVGTSQSNPDSLQKTAQRGSHPAKDKSEKFGDNFPSERTERGMNGKGMNKYSDVDERMNTSDAEARAKSLVDRADRNLQMNNPKEAVETVLNDRPIQKGLNKLSKNANETAGKAAEDAKSIGQRGMRSLQENAGQAADNLSENIRGVISQ